MAEAEPSAVLLTVAYGAACVGYLMLAALILIQARRSATGLLLAAACGATACWAGATVLTGAPLRGVAGGLDLLHSLAWYGFCLHLYRRAVAPNQDRLFTGMGVLGLIAAAAIAPFASADGAVSLGSPALLLRLALPIGQLLLLENLYRGTSRDQRWHVGLACVALGGLAAYDVAVCADAVLLRAAAPTLVAGRAVVAVLVIPLLAVAAARNRGWRVDIHVSRTAALHTATLVVSGVFLLALAAAGEMARRLGGTLGGWGSLAEICVVFAGCLSVATLATSGSARGALRGLLIDHFFTHRYDYRREWQRCIDILSAVGSGPLSVRVIRAVADAVDSPAGLLFTHEPGQAGLAWAGSWNTRPASPLPEDGLARAILAATGPMAVDAAMKDRSRAALDPSFDPWLAIPLRDLDPAAREPMGCILLARPRAGFRMDAEVADLLRILAHEVAIHLGQERATAALLQTRDLRAYGERFAFVAHDIKNVSSQLSLLLSNAETHLANPEFQQDMLATVRASIGRIGGMIRRLEPGPAAPTAPGPLELAPFLEALVASRVAVASLALDLPPEIGAIAMEEAALRAAVTHLLDNAETAAGPRGTVRVTVTSTATHLVLDITDDGPGMTPEFIRDELFRPFATRTPGGSGLGAFQARETLRAAGGALAVLSQPGHGTTMRLTLPRATAIAPRAAS